MMALRRDLVRLADWPAAEPLPGVIGADPRLSANADLGLRIFNESAARAASLVSGFRTAKLDRQTWIVVLEEVVTILEITRKLRQTLSRDQVPPITTPDYLQGCEAIANGSLAEAQQRFHKKLRTLRSLKPVSYSRPIAERIEFSPQNLHPRHAQSSLAYSVSRHALLTRGYQLQQQSCDHFDANAA